MRATEALQDLRVWPRAPRNIVLLFIATHIAIWSLTPLLLHWGLPLDLVEGYAVGHEWVMGYHKHPAAPWWLIEASRIITGSVGWPAYVVSASLGALTYWLAFLLGREILDDQRAAMGALLLSGVLYFSWVVPEFNHNIAQMPVWLAFILSLWRARQRGSNAWWITTGFLAALSLYAKLASLLLPALAVAYVLLDSKLRAALRTPGPWLALIAFLLAAAPLGYWLVTSDFLALEYAAQRSRGRAAGGAALFLGKQIASAAGLYVLVAWAISGTRERPENSTVLLPPPSPDAQRFLLWFLLAPPLTLVVLALVMGLGLKGSWATPMLSILGLTVVCALSPRLDGRAFRRIIVGAFVFLFAVPTAYAFVLQKPSDKLLTPKRTNWPQAEVAAEMQRIWRQATAKPLRIVAGDLWMAGMVSAHATDRPSVLVDGSLRYSPWIDRARIERDGFMAIWWRAAEDPPIDLRTWIGLRIDGQHVYNMRGSDRGSTAIVLYSIVKPGEIKAGTPLPDNRRP